jgi:hypothetical protein
VSRDTSTERRDRRPEGIGRRAQFEESVKLLADLTLPHQLVRAMVEKAAAPERVVLGRMGLDLSRPN